MVSATAPRSESCNFPVYVIELTNLILIHDFYRFFLHQASGKLTTPQIIGESGISQKSVDDSVATCDTALPCNHYISYDLGDVYNISQVHVYVSSPTELKIFTNKNNQSNLCYDGTGSPLTAGSYHELDCVKSNKRYLTVQFISDCSANTASLCDLHVFGTYFIFPLTIYILGFISNASLYSFTWNKLVDHPRHLDPSKSFVDYSIHCMFYSDYEHLNHKIFFLNFEFICWRSSIIGWDPTLYAHNWASLCIEPFLCLRWVILAKRAMFGALQFM